MIGCYVPLLSTVHASSTGGMVMAVSRPRRAARSRRTASSPSLGALAVLGLAGASGIAGLVLLLGVLAPPRSAPPAPPGTLIAGELSLQVQTSGWITHDDVGGPVPASVQNGFSMPASMMPGMPGQGTHRLYLEAVLSDVGQQTASYAPDELTVRSPSGGQWPLNQPASFGPGTLAPGQSRSLDLLFDVPDTVARLDLAWAHGGTTGSISVDATPPPAHQHG
jgi:hypothetical protein